MDSLYHQTNKMVIEIQSGLGRLEHSPRDTVHLVENELQARIDQVVSNCERLEILVNKEPATRRATAKLRVDQLKYDCQHVQAAMRNLIHRRYQKEEEERERDDLLSRRFTTNDEDTSIMIDHSLQHHNSLHNSNREMDRLIGSGNDVLTNLREQRYSLKGAHKKILDLANTLGLSNTVMKLIERRTKQDKVILIVGMVVTCILMFMIWKYLG